MKTTPQEQSEDSGKPGPRQSEIDRQRFAVLITEDCEVPREFQDSLNRVIGIYGHYVLAFFLPGMIRPGGSGTQAIPPRIVLLLDDHFALLSFHSVSGQISTLVINRSDLLGYRMTGFLLDCWITLYRAGEPTELQIQFPVQSGELYWDLVISLFHVGHLRTHKVSAPDHSVVPLNCPKAFTNFLHQHPESGEVQECFLQTSVPFSKDRRQKCANLFVARTKSGLLVLTDERIADASWLGLQVSYFPLSSLRRAHWADRLQTQQGALFLYLGKALDPLRIEWNVALRFREAAVRWVEELNLSLAARNGNSRHLVGEERFR